MRGKHHRRVLQLRIGAGDDAHHVLHLQLALAVEGVRKFLEIGIPHGFQSILLEFPCDVVSGLVQFRCAQSAALQLVRGEEL